MSNAFHVIDDANAPALGDVRDAGPGDLVYIRPAATSRRDFPKYWEAAGIALKRGALVSVLNREESQWRWTHGSASSTGDATS